MLQKRSIHPSLNYDVNYQFQKLFYIVGNLFRLFIDFQKSQYQLDILTFHMCIYASLHLHFEQ